MFGLGALLSRSGAPGHPPSRRVRDRDRADCDPAYRHAQQIKAKQAEARRKQCTGGYSVCIPPDVGDVDCGELGATDIQVTGDDPYGLDADGDGVGCES
jgi:hypothetical protein